MSDPWWPPSWQEGPVELPAFRVQRERYGPVVGGDYVRGSSVSTLPRTALRYPSTVPGYTDILGRAILFVRAKDYHTAQIMWDWPDHLKETWQEVALVRSAFGHPSTTNDGETVFRALRVDFETTTPEGEDTLWVPPVVEDQGLPSGRWYYYTLFFRVGPLDWQGGGGMMADSVLIPRDTGHSDHLFNTVPPYYRWVDDNLRAGAGPLHQFLGVFGFELDTTRSFIDNYQEMYHFDFSPVPLLKQVGNNIGVPYEGAIGDIRYRSLLAQIGKLYDIRGTAVALEKVCEAVSKYECDITSGRNMLLLPDDSDPYWSTGNWASVNIATWNDANLVAVPLDVPLGFQQVRFYLPKDGYPAAWNASYPATPPATVNPPPGGRGVLRIDTVNNDTQALFFGIGDGIQIVNGAQPGETMVQWIVGPDPSKPENQKSVIPLYGGVAVRPDAGYGFSFFLKSNQPITPTALMVTPILVWIGKSGQPDDVVGKTVGNPTQVVWVNQWGDKFNFQGVAPEGAVYLIPTIHVDNRVNNPASTIFSYYIDLASILVYQYSSEGVEAAVPPDRYLTLGDPAELIGARKEGFPGFVIGSPLQPGQQAL